jgi:hypothetical protein
MPPKEKPSADRHKGKLLGVRLPADLESALRESAASNRRTLTAEMVLAIEAYLQAAGLWPPGSKAAKGKPKG